MHFAPHRTQITVTAGLTQTANRRAHSARLCPWLLFGFCAAAGPVSLLKFLQLILNFYHLISRLMDFGVLLNTADYTLRSSDRAS